MSSESNKRSSDEKNDDDDSMPPAKRSRTTTIESPADNAPLMDIASSFDQGDLNATQIHHLVELMIDQLKQIKGRHSLESSADDKPPSEESSSPSEPTSSAIIPSLSNGLLLLRKWQRDLLQQCSVLEKSCQDQCRSKRRLEKSWGSLQYEKANLEEKITKEKNHVMPFLEQVLAQRHRKQRKDEQRTTDDSETVSTLTPLEPNNPNHRASILRYLHLELSKRSSLEKQRDALKSKLKSLQKKCEEEQKMLIQLPQQLATLEQASKPLQNWFSLPYIGSVRMERLQLAQQLPAPLYTLFVSLQEYLDLVESPRIMAGDEDSSFTASEMRQTDKMILRVVPTIGLSSTDDQKKGQEGQDNSSQPHEVQWSLPVPDIFTSKHRSNNNSHKKRAVTIHFQYCEEKSPTGPRFIKASVSGCPTALDQSLLLSYLFSNEHAGDGYYRWCHYLGGVHLVTSATTSQSPSPSPSISLTPPSTTSTRTIVQTVKRRIRANATLKYILQSLCQHHKIPPIPVAKHSDDSTVAPTLAPPSSWQASFTQQSKNQEPDQSGGASTIFIYDVHCKKSLSRTNILDIRASVEIDKAQYPAVPPFWKLFPDTHDSSSPALYNVTWDLLERDVNRSLLSDASRAGKAQGEVESEESLLFAEWILVHQLNRLLHKWEEVASSGSASGSAERAVRGRDRVPLSLVEPDKY